MAYQDSDVEAKMASIVKGIAQETQIHGYAPYGMQSPEVRRSIIDLEEGMASLTVPPKLANGSRVKLKLWLELMLKLADTD